MPDMQELLCMSAQDMLALVQSRQALAVDDDQHLPKAQMVAADPPWEYENFGLKKHGAARGHYPGRSVPDVAGDLGWAMDVAALDAYLVVWCTFPKLEEWMLFGSPAIRECRPKAKPNDQRGWRYVSGGAWAKINGLGPGYHWRGDCEPALLYTKGSPLPRTEASNLWMAPRVGHSEKPQLALRRQVCMCTDPGGLVIDLYAGASASLARACRAVGRRYIGAEIDPERHAQALQAYGAQELEMEVWPLERAKGPAMAKALVPTEASSGKEVGWAEVETKPRRKGIRRRDGL